MNISSITYDGVGITAKVMVKNDATFDATKGDLYAKLLESAEKHEVELSFEKRIVPLGSRSGAELFKPAPFFCFTSLLVSPKRHYFYNGKKKVKVAK